VDLALTLKNSTIFQNLKNSGFYLGGSLVQLAVSLVTSPIYARHLEANEFAIIGYFTALGHFFTPLLNLSFTTYYLINYFRKSDEENAKILFNLVFFLNVSNLVMVLLSLGALRIYFNATDVSFPLFPYALLVLLSMYFMTYKSYTLINFRIRKKAWQFFLLSASYALLNASFGIFYVVNLDWGAAGRLGGPLTGQIILGIICILILKQYARFEVDFKIIKDGLRVTFPLILASYAYVVLQNIDQIFLERLGNANELGFYNIGFMISNYAAMAGAAIYMAFEPDIFKQVAKKNRKKLFQYLALITGILFGMTIVFISISEWITSILTSGRYTRAYVYANLDMIGFFFLQIFGLLSAIINALRRTRAILVINVVASLFALLAFRFLIDKYGYLGGCYGKITISIFLSLLALLFLLIRNTYLVKKYI
jgi:O-antigen/teichoic acid export membrane protein